MAWIHDGGPVVFTLGELLDYDFKTGRGRNAAMNETQDDGEPVQGACSRPVQEPEGTLSGTRTVGR